MLISDLKPAAPKLAVIDTLARRSGSADDLCARPLMRIQKKSEEVEALWFPAQQVELPLRPGHAPQTSLAVQQSQVPAAPNGNDLERIASSMAPGETLTLSKLISRCGRPRGETSYKHIEQKVPATPVEAKAEYEVRRIMRMPGNGRGGVTCMVTD